jgi:endonuclease III
LSSALDLLERAYGRIRLPKEESLLERFVYFVLVDGTSPAKASKALDELHETFVDWNEVRVTKPYEVRKALSAIADGREQGKAEVIVAALQKIFADKSKLSFDFLEKIEPAARRKYLSALRGVPPWIRAVLLLLVEKEKSDQSDALRVARRIPIVDKRLTPAKAREKLAALFPGDELHNVISVLVQHGTQICLPRPKCVECFLKTQCKEGISNTTSAERAEPPVDALLAAAAKNRPVMSVPWERPKAFVLPKVSPPPAAKRRDGRPSPPPLPKGPRGRPGRYYD